MNFRKKLSSQARARLDAVTREMDRLHGLPDRWLANELLDLARRARKEQPEKLGNPLGSDYDTTIVWHLAPRLAKMLGARDLQPNENQNPDIAAATGQTLRNLTGAYFRLNALAPLADGPTKTPSPSACELLGHDFVNGNPIAMALDRLVPAPATGCDADDWIARHVREVQRARSQPCTGVWHPKCSPEMMLPRMRKILRRRWPEAIGLLDNMLEKARTEPAYKSALYAYLRNEGSTLMLRELVEPFGRYMAPGQEGRGFRKAVDGIDTAHGMIANARELSVEQEITQERRTALREHLEESHPEAITLVDRMFEHAEVNLPYDLQLEAYFIYGGNDIEALKKLVANCPDISSNESRALQETLAVIDETLDEVRMDPGPDDEAMANKGICSPSP